jgi:hypothetical protein
MPHKSSKSRSKRKSQSQSHSQSQSENQFQNQTGGSNEPIKIDDATLKQAGDIAQRILNKAVAPQGGGGSAALQGSELSAASSGTASVGLKNAMVGGALAGAVVGAESYSSLKGSAIVGGKKRRGRKYQSQSQSQSQSQKGGMIPGLLSAVETALVPLGLYMGQKALQSRRPGSRSLGKSFNFRRASRRTRRRR